MKHRIERFEDLIAWQKARKLTESVYALTSGGPIARDFPLRDQLHGAAISVPANIAEGFERSRLREFHQFLSIAKSSCAEVRTYLHISGDVGYIKPEQQQSLLAAAEEVARLIGGLRSSVARAMRPRLRTQDSGLRTARTCS